MRREEAQSTPPGTLFLASVGYLSHPPTFLERIFRVATTLVEPLPLWLTGLLVPVLSRIIRAA